MDLNKTKKFIFYHVPKSGGTAIFNAIRNIKGIQRAHPNINHVKISKYPPNSNDIPFTVIRHPYSRFVSAFYHLKDACNTEFYYKNANVSDCEWLQNRKINMDIFNDPNEFLMALFERINPYHKIAQKIFYHFDIFKSQFYWLSNRYNNTIHPSIKMILRQENLEQDLRQIEIQLGQKINLPQGKDANKRITRYTVPLNDLSKGIIRSIYKEDFKFFSFEK